MWRNSLDRNCKMSNHLVVRHCHTSPVNLQLFRVLVERLPATIRCDRAHGMCGRHKETFFLKIRLQQMNRLMDCDTEHILSLHSTAPCLKARRNPLRKSEVKKEKKTRNYLENSVNTHEHSKEWISGQGPRLIEIGWMNSQRILWKTVSCQ